MSRVDSQRGAAVLAALILTCCGGSGNVSPAASTAPASPRPVVGARELEVTAASGSFVHDVRYSAGQQTVAAYVVVPRTQLNGAAVVFLHWLGQDKGNRSEFLDEAQQLAGKGVMSLLAQGTFPWSDPPSGIEHDRPAIAHEIAALRAGLDLVLAQPGVDAQRVAFVGHDYGAMHGVGLLATEHRFKGAVLMTADAHYVDWFADFWHFIKTDAQRAEYAAQMRPFDPVTVVSSARGPVLFQFAKTDEFLPAGRAQELIDAAPAAGKTVSWYDADHALNDAARTDRDRWLGQLLQLP